MVPCLNRPTGGLPKRPPNPCPLAPLSRDDLPTNPVRGGLQQNRFVSCDRDRFGVDSIDVGSSQISSLAFPRSWQSQKTGQSLHPQFKAPCTALLVDVVGLSVDKQQETGDFPFAGDLLYGLGFFGP